MFRISNVFIKQDEIVKVHLSSLHNSCCLYGIRLNCSHQDFSILGVHDSSIGQLLSQTLPYIFAFKIANGMRLTTPKISFKLHLSFVNRIILLKYILENIWGRKGFCIYVSTTTINISKIDEI